MAEVFYDQVRAKLLDERHHQVGGVLVDRRQGHQGDTHDSGYGELQQKLHAGSQSQVSLVDDLEIVIGEPDSAKADGREYDQPDEMVGKVCPEQGGNDDRDGNQYAAHGWGAGFFLVGLGALFTDVLADLKFPKLADNGRPNNEGHKHGREAGKGGTEGYIAEDTKR